MTTHNTTYRVIYGDTDNMGFVYYGNYLRWFEIGRTEFFRNGGLTYKEIESQGVFLPVAEVQCKYLSPAHYDDLIIIETTADKNFRSGIKFDYRIINKETGQPIAVGYTKHAFVDPNGRVIRPPESIKNILSA